MPYRFDEWESLADYNTCNYCERFWNNQCDGSKRTTEDGNQECPSEAITSPSCDFKATRKVTIPDEIKELQNGYKRLRKGLSLLALVFILFIIGTLIF